MGNTDLDVFPLCLGGNVFGWTLDEERSFEVLDAYVEAGGNFIDMADSYGRQGPGGAGESERIIGRWITARRNRDQLVIATKVGSTGACGARRGDDQAGYRGLAGASGDRQRRSHYAHKDDPDTPLEETLGAFGALVEEGKIRHAAASNYSASRIAGGAANRRARGDGLLRCPEPHYNLMERGEYEGELAEVCARNGLACVPYFGLARGFLTGKYRRGGDQVDSPRAAGVRESYFNERGFAVLDALDEIAAAHGTTVAAVALAWLVVQPTVVAPIASATSPEQLAELLPSAELELSATEIERLNTASA